ncbi:MAG: hypothetical protein KA293_12115 [Bacteroidia bacterium]|nr:hypothetical protein [Bacteroidia bacterium]
MKSFVFAVVVILTCIGSATAQSSAPKSGVKVERTYNNGKVSAVRHFDREGRLIFWKYNGIFEALCITTVRYSGDSICRLECTVQAGTLQVIEKYETPEARTQRAATYKGVVTSILPDYADLNNGCSVNGFPKTREAWHEHAPLMARLAGPTFLMMEENLAPNGDVLEMNEFDETGMNVGGTKYKYDASGCLQETIRTIRGVAGETRTKYAYDKENHLIQKLVLSFGRGKIDTTEIEAWTYQGSQMATRELRMGSQRESEEFSYDTDGKLTESILTSHHTPNSTHCRLRYDAQEQLLTQELKTGESGLWKVTNTLKRDYEYW